MSELLNQEPININISNSTSSGSEQSFLGKILDTGLKVLIPLGILFGIALIYVIITVVIPFITNVTSGLGDFLGTDEAALLPFAFGPIGGIIAGTGTLLGWIVGR